MKIKNGQFSGKGSTVLGKMCAYNLNGVNVMRSIPASVAIDQSDEAVAKRLRFARLSSLIKQLSFIFARHTIPMRSGQNFRNPASTANNNAVTCAVNASPIVDYSVLTLSKGSVTNQTVAMSYNSSTNIVTCTYVANGQYGTSPNDRVNVACITESPDLISSLEDDSVKAAGTSTSMQFDCSTYHSGTVLHFYSFTKKAVGANYSNSVYLGKVTVV